jgi:hypothetical protein
MNQCHLRAEESIWDWTRQLVLVEVAAENQKKYGYRYILVFISASEMVMNNLCRAYKCFVLVSLSRPIPPFAEIGMEPVS